jgi:transcription antitermination factor NusG
VRFLKLFGLTHYRKYEAGKSQLNLAGNNSAGEKKWYVFYLRHRTEKRVCEVLIRLGYEVFLPVISTVRIWKNRQKRKILLPLFPGYLFVYTHAHELYPIRQIPHVVFYVASGGKPSTVSEKEIEEIRQVLGVQCPVTIERRFFKGERVRIMSGPLVGYEGTLVRQHSKTRFGIRLKAINYTVLIDTAQLELEKL